MRLAVLNITAGGISGGYRKYLNNIIPCLLASKDITSLLVAVPEGTDFAYYQKEYPSAQWLALRPKIWLLSGIDKQAKEKIIDFSPDVIFIPTSRFWRIKNIPVVNMVRNMEPFFKSKIKYSFLKGLKLIVQYWSTKRTVFQSDRVIAVSDYVKHFLISKWNVTWDRIGVIPHGCRIESRVENEKPPVLPKNIKKGSFLFTAGSICSYRGLEDIIGALGSLKRKNALVPELLIAGKTISHMSGYEHSLKKRIEEEGVCDKVHWLGELGAQELGWCYANCAVFLMTSRVEACPNIALEAMSYGCVCVSTKNSPMPEFFTDCAVYYDAGDKVALAGAIYSVLKWKDEEKTAMSKRAQARAGFFLGSLRRRINY